jgi:hypothetical protein
MTQTVPTRCYTHLTTGLHERFGEDPGNLLIDAGFTCPNRDGKKARGGCTFCDLDPARTQRQAEPENAIREQVRRQIEASDLQPNAPRNFIASFQPFSNTYAPLEILRQSYEAVLDEPRIAALMVSTRSDCVTRSVCNLLASYRSRVPVWLELGLHTTNQATLDRMNRHERVEDFAEACGDAREVGLNVTAHILFGLPEDDRETNLRTVAYAVVCGATDLKIHNRLLDRSASDAPLPREIEMASPDALEIIPAEITIHPFSEHSSSNDDAVMVEHHVVAEMQRRGSVQGCKAMIECG